MAKANSPSAASHPAASAAPFELNRHPQAPKRERLPPDPAFVLAAGVGSGGSDAGTQNFRSAQLGAASMSLPTVGGGGSSSPLHLSAGAQVPTTISW
jgi:hypothetical protein